MGEQVKEIHDLVFYQIEEISDDEILSDGSFRNLRGLQIKAHTLEILEVEDLKEEDMPAI